MTGWWISSSYQSSCSFLTSILFLPTRESLALHQHCIQETCFPSFCTLKQTNKLFPLFQMTRNIIFLLSVAFGAGLFQACESPMCILGASVFLGAFCFTCILARALGCFFWRELLDLAFSTVVLSYIRPNTSTANILCPPICWLAYTPVETSALLLALLISWIEFFNTLFQWLSLSHLNQLLILGSVILWGPRQKTTLVLGVLWPEIFSR